MITVEMIASDIRNICRIIDEESIVEKPTQMINESLAFMAKSVIPYVIDQKINYVHNDKLKTSLL